MAATCPGEKRRTEAGTTAGRSDMMTNEELAEYNRQRRIHQIAWVTRDLDKSLKAWVEHLKVGPWRVYPSRPDGEGPAVGGLPSTSPSSSASPSRGSATPRSS